MKYFSIELLEVLLEETVEASHVLVEQICLHIKVERINQFMNELWNVRNRIPSKCKPYKQALYGAYHIICKVKEYLPENTKEFFKKMDCVEENGITKDTEDRDLMLLHVKRWSRSIEVNYMADEESSVLTKVYFPYDPDVRVIELFHQLTFKCKLCVLVKICTCVLLRTT